MIKVLIISPVPSSRGGISNWIATIMKNKHKANGFELFNLTTYAYKAQNNKRSFFERYIMSFFDVFIVNKRLKKMIKNNTISIVHIAGTGGHSLFRDKILIKTAKKMGVKVVYHIHFGKLMDYYESDSKKWKSNKKVLCMVDAVMCLDPRTFYVCSEILQIQQSFMVPNPIDMESVLTNNVEKEECITFLGWVIKTKGVEELLGAWSKIRPEFKHLTLNLVGPIDEKYKKYLKDNFNTDNVAFHGRMEHNKALEILSKSKIMVLPSYTEGFPNVILESMSLKTPVIATDVGAIKNILSDDCGFVVPPRDTEELQKALVSLLRSKTTREAIANNAFKKVSTQYDITSIFKLYLNIYNLITEGRKDEK